MDKKANKLFKEYYKEIVKHLKHSETTYSDELESMGKRIFGSLFLGVFSSDKIPELKSNEMAIVNLDKESQPGSGSHWVSFYKKNNNLWVYDSFGRSVYSILPVLRKISGRIKEPDRDPEQKGYQSNCGQLSMSWLAVAHHHGIDYAKHI